MMKSQMYIPSLRVLTQQTDVRCVSTLQVPLLIRSPGGVEGQVIKSPVQVFDIVPTMLDLANISLKHVQFGVSQKDVILEGVQADPTRAVFAEGGYATNEPRDNEGAPLNWPIPHDPKQIYYPKSKQQLEQPLSVCRAASVRTSTHKLILRTDPTSPQHHSELYDLVSDPRELYNVYGNTSYTQVTAELTQKLFLWYMQTSDVSPYVPDDRNGGPNFPWPPSGTVHQSPHPTIALYCMHHYILPVSHLMILFDMTSGSAAYIDQQYIQNNLTSLSGQTGLLYHPEKCL